MSYASCNADACASVPSPLTSATGVVITCAAYVRVHKRQGRQLGRRLRRVDVLAAFVAAGLRTVCCVRVLRRRAAKYVGQRGAWPALVQTNSVYMYIPCTCTYRVRVQGLWMRVRLWRRRRVDFRVQNKTFIIFVHSVRDWICYTTFDMIRYDSIVYTPLSVF